MVFQIPWAPLICLDKVKFLLAKLLSGSRLSAALKHSLQQPRWRVCLECSQLPQDEVAASIVIFDIDSIMGFPSSLNFAKQGIRFNLAPHVIQNLSTNLHLTLAIPFILGHNDTQGRRLRHRDYRAQTR